LFFDKEEQEVRMTELNGEICLTTNIRARFSVYGIPMVDFYLSN